MRQTKKKPTNPKKVSTKVKKEPTLETVEKQYVNVKEYESEILTKTSRLKMIVAVFSVFLFTFWIITLRYSIKSQSDNLNFSFLKEEINNSINRFDTEILNRQKAQEIIVNDIDEIKNKLELQNKKLNSSLWPTREISEMGITIQYPENWQRTSLEESKSQLTLEETENNLSININLEKTEIKDLSQWLEKSNIDFTLYEKTTDIFKFSTDTPERIIYTKELNDNQTEKIYFLKKENNLLEIKTVFNNNDEENKLIIEEIIKTIKIN